MVLLDPCCIVFQRLKAVAGCCFGGGDSAHKIECALIRLNEVVQSVNYVIVKVAERLVLGIASGAGGAPMLEVRKVAGVKDPADKLFDHVLTPIVPLPAAEPPSDAAVAAPPEETTHPEYVYLLRVVSRVPLEIPNAKMPTTLLPAAEP